MQNTQELKGSEVSNSWGMKLAAILNSGYPFFIMIYLPCLITKIEFIYLIEGME